MAEGGLSMEMFQSNVDGMVIGVMGFDVSKGLKGISFCSGAEIWVESDKSLVWDLVSLVVVGMEAFDFDTKHWALLNLQNLKFLKQLIIKR